MIAAEVVFVAVAVLLAIGLVPSVLVTDDVGKRETIVAGDIVYAGCRIAAASLE